MSFLQPKLKSGALLLEDGALFRGHSFGYEDASLAEGAAGELVFNTAMSGYQEILTDPSYCGQIVMMTYPLIGNYGVNSEDLESSKLFLNGFIVHEYSEIEANWRSNMNLRDYLIRNRIPALTGIDTRAVTRHIRAKGAMNATILSPSPRVETELKGALSRLRALPPFGEKDLVARVSTTEISDWNEGVDDLHAQWRSEPLVKVSGSPLVVVLDMGCKWNSLRNFTARGARVKVLPVGTSVEKILALKPAGLFLSNGPGDPTKVAHAADTTRKLLGKLPIFGICMGHQILSEAIGAKTFKMKFGHHGGNQPVLDLETGRVMITSQNHGYAVDPASLPGNVKVTQINLNDKSVEGIALPKERAFSVQYHPEACPGPRDAEGYFDDFMRMLG
jgi:carbamoyl-phosphate synthase small subunit